MKIRAHHLLCMQLYEGKGYSEAFCKGMEQVIKELRTNRKSFTLQTKSDAVCNNCPNKVNGTNCRLGNEDVEKKDRAVLKVLGLKENEELVYETVKKTLETNIDELQFFVICGSCRWYQEKICTYSKWKNSFID